MTESLTGLALGPFCAFLSSCTWALGSGVYSRLSEGHSAFSINFTRSLVALPLFLLAAGWFHGWETHALIEWKHLGWLTLSMVASYGLADVLFLKATRDLGVPSALSIASLYPIWTLLIGVLRGDGEIRALQVLGLILTLAGIVFTLQVGKQVRMKGVKKERSDITRGILLAAVTSVLWATNSFAVAQGAADLPVHWVNVIRMALALLVCGFLGAATAIQGGRPARSVVVPWKSLRSAFWVFPLEAFGGSLFFAYGLSHSPLVLGATLSSLAPVISVPLAWLFGQERVSFQRMVGVMGVVLGLALLLNSG
jgi:drug/metabolite transporter (DMT)-like permease